MNWRPPLLDALIAVAFVGMVAAEVLAAGVVSPVVAVLAGLAMCSLAWRRRAPLVVAAVVIVAHMFLDPDGDLSTVLSLVLVCFTIGRHAPPPRGYAGLALVLVPFLLGLASEGFEAGDLGAALVFVVGPWTVGAGLAGRIASADLAVARAEQLERDRELETARAAAEERARIARELHDIVSHSISVVTIQTQAVRRRLGPDQAREAADLAAVEATAREALGEMRRLFGVLRTDGDTPALAPQPGLTELDRLVAQVGSADVRVHLSVEGEPVPLSPGLDLAAYRIAQEGLTNALRHARASQARVLVRYAGEQLEIEVDDDGQGLTAPAAGGHGLVGIRERVTLYGGTVHLGPSPLGGIRLAARLPLSGASA